MSRLFITFLVLTMLYSCGEKRTLPILGQRYAEKNMVDGKEVIDTVYQTVPKFEFLNQDSVIITNSFNKGKVYTADFFFTTCPTICPIVKKHMLKVQEAFLDDDRINFLSHTLDPLNDSPSELKKYRTNLGVKTDRWQFLTGDRDATFRLSNMCLVAAVPDLEAPGGINHSGKIILIDTKGRMRGFYEGTIEEEVDKLIEDIKVLLDEEFN